MNKLEQAAKIKECRKTAKFLMGDSYPIEIECYKNMIRRRCKVIKCDNPLEGVANIMASPKLKDNELMGIYLLAAAAEIIDPE